MARPKGGGYGRPPVETRFGPGQTGNAKGRPKGSKNLATLVRQALNEKLTIHQNGRSKRVSKAEVIAKQLVNKSAGGDWAALRLLFGFYQMFGDAPPAASTDANAVTEADRAILERLQTRLKNLKAE